MNKDIVIQARDLCKTYFLDASHQSTLRDSLSNMFSSSSNKSFEALKDISFDVHKGDVLGVIGRNGAGKSTLLKILSRITKPTSGQVMIDGRVSSLLEVGTGFHHELTGRENIFLNGSILGLRRKEISKQLDEIIDFSGVEEFLDVPVKKYSSGMYVRLAFAVAAHLNPEILLVDEVLSVGDYEFQQKCLGKMDDITNDGRTILMVSHNIGLISRLVDKVLVLDKGQGQFFEDKQKGIQHYLQSNQLDSEHRAGSIIEKIKLETPGEDGQVFSGKDLECEFLYNTSKEYKNLILRFEVKDSLGNFMFLCNNRISGDQLAPIKNNGSFRCIIHDLPLMSGDYSLDYILKSDDQLIDESLKSINFKVLNDHYYSTGLEPVYRAGVLTKYKFS